MSETTTTTQAIETTEAKASIKAKAKAKSKPKNASPKRNVGKDKKASGKLLKPVRQVLSTLKNGQSLSRPGIAGIVGKKNKLINGRIAAETKTYAGLVACKYITCRSISVDGKNEIVYKITAAGKKALSQGK